MRQFLHFAAGLIIPSILYCIAGYILFLKTFSFSDTLAESDRKIALFFYLALAAFTLSSFIAFRLLKAKRKHLGLGISLSLIPVFIFLLKIGIVYFNQLNYYQPFDKSTWASSNKKPFNMAKTLASKKTLIGLSRTEVINKLGYNLETTRSDGSTLMYPTEKHWYFYVDLNNDIVVDAYLHAGPD